MTAIGDLDGYADTAHCVLLPNNMDYTDQPPAMNCSSPFQYHVYYNETFPDVTLINCSGNTSPSQPLQGTWTWWLSCVDFYGNAQSFDLNTKVWFTVDWEEPPNITVFLDSESGMDLTNDTLECSAVIFDPESDFDPDSTVITWLVDGKPVSSSSAPPYTLVGDEYHFSSLLSPDKTGRGDNITCEVYASDTVGMNDTRSDSLVIRNSPPIDSYLLAPALGTAYDDEMLMYWVDALDADDDYLTYTIEVDNESASSVPVFNNSNNALLDYYPVKVLPVTGVKSSPSVYRDLIAYVDDRKGDDDIYLYDTLTGVDTAVAMSTAEQSNPKVYGDYVIFEEGAGAYRSVKKFDMASGVTTTVADSVIPGSMDYFGDEVVYANYSSGAIFVFDLSSGDRSLVYTDPKVENTQVYGDLVAWDNTTHSFLYELKTKTLTVLDGTAPKIFGRFVVFNGSASNLYDIKTGSLGLLPLGSSADYDLYGHLLAQVHAGSVEVLDITRPSVAFVLPAGSSPAIYDDLVVWEHNNNVYYARENRSLPYFWTVEDLGALPVYDMVVNSTADGLYAWRLEVCDSSADPSGCTFASSWYDASKDFELFNVDRTPPTIVTTSPTDDTIVGGSFRIWAVINDSLAPHDSTVSSAHYRLTFRDNASVYLDGSLARTGSTWQSSVLDFAGIDLANFTLDIWANDTVDNMAHRQVNFTYDKDWLWFAFGTGDQEIVHDWTVYGGSQIDADFIAYNVYQSTLKITGPLPDTTTRFIPVYDQ